MLLSGGFDSATVLAIARQQGYACHALSLDYGQRHRSEPDAAAEISPALGAVSHSVVKLDLTLFGGSALTDASFAVPVSGPADSAALGVDFARTVSCCQADAHGRACAVCDACRIRRDGFLSAGIPDPTRYQHTSHDRF